MRFRDRVIGVFGLAALLGGWIVADTWGALGRIADAHEGERTLISALRLHQDADMMHDAIRADVFSALLGHPDARVSLDLHIDALRTDLTALDALNLPEPAAAAVAAPRASLLRWVREADLLSQLASSDREVADARTRSFITNFDAAATEMAAATEALALARSAAEDAAVAERDAIRSALAWHMIGAVTTVCVAIGMVGAQGLAGLQRIREVAGRLSAGDLSARSTHVSKDELGELAGTFNELGESLQALTTRNAAEADRMRFSGRLAEALEMAETERDVVAAAEIAMAEIGVSGESSLMLADSSRAKLTVAAGGGSRACDVESPWACVAMRRATPMVFPSSAALGACPRLRGGDICSAVCLPLNFTGRAIGVYRTTAAPGSPDSDALARLTMIANQTGARIGAIRAMDRATLQAGTDALTGLVNRRTLEARVQHLAGPYAVVMADLDHFKKLNDTFGHQAGDHALRLFGQTVKKVQRADDIACRYGGEEFVVVMPGANAADAVGAAARLRSTLASSFTGSTPVFTLSCGIADSTMEASFEDVLRAADDALYAAKSQGRDRAVIHGGSLPAIG